MVLMITGTAPEDVAGEWVPCGPIEVQLRPILRTKREEIELSVPSIVARVNRKDGTAEVDQVRELQRTNKLNLIKGRFALMDTRGFEIKAGNQAWASMLSKITKAPVAIGDVVTIDGHWTDEMKSLLLPYMDNAGAWCPFEVDERDKQGNVVMEEGAPKKTTLQLLFPIWVVWMAEQLGETKAAFAAELKS